jgi:DNA-binding LacI/PurR family transcriptional regulator
MLPEKKAVNLKTVAARVGLAPCSVSAVLNNTKAARAIPQKTKNRIYRAAAELNYRPNIVARSLRTKRTRMVAVIAPGLGGFGVARVVAAAQRRLHQSGYLLVLATSDGDGANHLCAQFQQRGIEGVIAINANLPAQMNMPVTSVDLDYKTSATSVSDEMEVWLPDLGNTAAETIMRQIENTESEDSSRKMHIPVIPAAYVDLPSMDRGFPAAESA